MLSSLHSDARGELSSTLLEELTRRLSSIDDDLSPERTAARFKSLLAAYRTVSGPPPRDLLLTRYLLLTTAAIALAAIGELDRRGAS